ncbi:hypothetical protein K525DRAFT_232765 [Schizophyllum commune Loenen D]|nr:hypothetical protein K525DRAFT_232765 [Schizophyllum commune Loenen D]
MSCDVLLKRAASLASIELQRRDFVPSTLETQAIREISKELINEIRSIDAEDERLSHLRCQMVNQLEVNQSVAAPVRRLPLELLMEVFIHYSESISSTLCMMTVPCVCRFWRRVARSTPELWTSFNSRAQDRSYRHLWPDILALSGMLPLTLDHYAIDDERLEEFLAFLRPHAVRWQSINLSGTCTTFQRQPSTCLPNLEVAYITLKERPGNGALKFLANTPALKLLRLELVIPPNGSEAMLPAEEMGAFILTDILSILRSCHACLTTLNVLVPNVPTLAMDDLLVMKKLSTLELGAASYRLLDCLETPAAEKISLDNINEFSDGNPFPTLADFLARLRHPTEVKKLCFAYIRMQSLDGSFLECMEYLQHLRELHVQEPTNSARTALFCRDVLVELTCVEDRAPLLPNLATFSLTVNESDGRMFPAWRSALTEMVRSREVPRICAGQAVVALERFDTNVDFTVDS